MKKLTLPAVAMLLSTTAIAQESQIQINPNSNNGLGRIIFENPAQAEIRYNENNGVLSLLARNNEGLYPYLIFNPQSPAHQVTIQRLYTQATGAVNPKTLNVQTTVRGSGETSGFPTGLASYFVSDTLYASGQAGDAISGVFEKRQQNSGIGFGGHFQCKDLNPVTMGGCIGFESNVVALGPDVYQNRMVADIIARTLRNSVGQPAGPEASVSRAIRIRDDAQSGYFERGIEFDGDFPGGQLVYGKVDGFPVYMRLNIEKRRLEWCHGDKVLATIPLDSNTTTSPEPEPAQDPTVPEWCPESLIGVSPLCTPGAQ